MSLPVWLINAYLDMLPRLRAEEALTGLNVAIVGSGKARKEDARRITAQWRRDAGGGRPRTRQKLSPRQVAGLPGINVKRRMPAPVTHDKEAGSGGR